MKGELPTETQLKNYKKKLLDYIAITETQRLLMSYPIEEMSPMAALRFGVGLLRIKQTYRDQDTLLSIIPETISSDEDSIAMETAPKGTWTATYEFAKQSYSKLKQIKTPLYILPWMQELQH